MQIKKFVGTTIREATERMREELGPNAIILNTRKISSGKLLNFLGKEMLEITAAIDEYPPINQKKTPEAEKKIPGSYAFSKVREAYGIDIGDRKQKQETKTSKEYDQRLPYQTSQNSPDSELYLLRSEVEEMRQVLTQIADHLKYTKMPVLPLSLQQVFLRLVNNDVEETIAADLIQKVYARLTEAEYDNRQRVEDAIVNEITKFITTKSLPTEHQKRSYVVTLVGPTGVGKTTTIAKLAAIHKLLYHQNVALITADTYRIGAIEQLRTFASIADIPVQVVYQPTEIHKALKIFKKHDLVFIDTVGRSQRAKKEILELRRFVEAAESDEVHLVLNASSGRKVLLDVVERFKALRPNRYLISKVDEAIMMGGVLSILQHHRMPISYITNGQNVPDDIMPIEPVHLAAMISGVSAHA
ncbi:MAG: flagellar biosynthesis protein FlhF [Bacteroidetes bacterium]|nr:flagellar biosynthesis protein FlhF [Bacteroidota bacterium]